LKIKHQNSIFFGIDIYSPKVENLKYFNFIKEDLNKKYSLRSFKKIDIIYSFRCFMYLKNEIKLKVIQEAYEILNVGGVLLIDLCGNPNRPSEMTEDDYLLLNFLSKKIKENGKLIKKIYPKEIKLLNEEITPKDRSLIARIKDIETYSLLLRKNQLDLNF
jgi:SAM-dependent methyltransferase